MANLKQKVKTDFINKTDVSFSFDTTKLETNIAPPKKKFNKKWLFLLVPSVTVVSLVLVVSVAILSVLLTKKESVHVTRKKYSAAEIAVAEANTFRRLNSFDYPPLSGNRYIGLDVDDVNAFNAFTNTIYQALDYEENATFAPVTLYPLLSLLAMGSSSPTLDAQFDALFLNKNAAARTALYQTIFKNNFYHNDQGTSLLHNGAFVDYNYDLSAEYLANLTHNYFEAFALDYTNKNDINKMLGWINDSMQEDGFIKENDLEIDDETMMYLFASFIFSNGWTHKYYESDNETGPFYLLDGTTTPTTYMQHKYFGTYYDYDKYISFYDSYTNGNRVQYIVPKAHTDNIYDLLGTNMFLTETGEEHLNEIIELKAPIFTTSNIVDFKAPLKNLGFDIMFDRNAVNFDKMFAHAPLTSYVQTIKQKNEVTFNVDGTIVKSLAFAGVGSKSASPIDTLVVSLDQPFIYVIRDINNIPLFVGHFDNPLH